ncbi:hypothetical protein R50072_19350 [Simiduia litorea]
MLQQFFLKPVRAMPADIFTTTMGQSRAAYAKEKEKAVSKYLVELKQSPVRPLDI